jgi:hypothetical protein
MHPPSVLRIHITTQKTAILTLNHYENLKIKHPHFFQKLVCGVGNHWLSLPLLADAQNDYPFSVVSL